MASNSKNPNSFGFCSSANSIFSNTNSKETLIDSDIAESSRLRERHVISAYTESSSKDDEPNKDEEYEFVEKEKFEYYKETNEEIEERRRLDHLAAMWPVISANTKSFCIDDDAGNGIAVQIAEANKAFAAAIKAVVAANEAANKVAAYAAASTAATAPRFQYFAVQIAEANKAFAAAIKPVAAANEAANKVAAVAARMEQLKLETKALLDSQTQFSFCGSVNKDPAVIELENKILSDKARKALEHYKETNDEEYEFVENEKYESIILPPFMAAHVTFKAKPKEKADSCPKLFFAEIYNKLFFGEPDDYEPDDIEVKMCMILDSCGPDVKMGCGFDLGHKDMLHPSGVKFWTGAPSETREWDEFEARNSSSRT